MKLKTPIDFNMTILYFLIFFQQLDYIQSWGGGGKKCVMVYSC